MRPSALEPHRPKLTLIAGGPCICAVCRRQRFETRVQIALIGVLVSAATIAWWVAGWPWR